MPAYNILTVEEAAKLLKLSTCRIRQFCREGRIGRRLGGRWAIDQDELYDFRRQTRPNGRPARAL